MSHTIFLSLLISLFSGCSNAPENGVPLILNSGNLTITDKEKVVEEQSKPQIEVKKESIYLYIPSQQRVSLNIGNTKTVSFNSSTPDILLKTDRDIVDIELPTKMCNGTNCSISIKAKSSGTDVVTISAKSDPTVYLKIYVTVQKVVEVVVTTPKESETDSNKTSDSSNTEADIKDNNTDDEVLNSKDKLAFKFKTGQSTKIYTSIGESIIVTTVLDYPRDKDEKINVVPMAENKVEIQSTKKDEELSTDNRYIFKTSIIATSSGVERVSFRVVDSNISISLKLTIDSVVCGVSEKNFNVLKSGSSNSQLILGSKLGFNSVEIIYPKLTTSSKLELQNFIYISDSKDGSTSHSNSAINSFSFIKFIEDLEGKDYKIRYKKNGDLKIICLNGIFPKRDILQESIKEEVVEENAPKGPSN